MDAWHKESRDKFHVIVVDKDDYDLILNALCTVISDYEGVPGNYDTVYQSQRLKAEIEK